MLNERGKDMSVAKSYEKYDIVSEPYEHDKRQYVKIKYPCCRKSSCSKCGGEGYYLKEVRWYDEPIVFNARNGFGFCEAGYITLIKGDDTVLENYFTTIAPRQARYNLIFKWFIPSWLPLPELPMGAHFERLEWSTISSNDKIFDYDTVRDIINGNTNETFYVGSVGDKIVNDFVVIDIKVEKGYYGDSTTFVLEDEETNKYLWKTSARKLEIGEIYHLKGTIKEHSKIEGTKYTVLTRCREG